MKITHVTNSFLSVEASSTKLICDPWNGSANYGGWNSLPEISEHLLLDHIKPATHIYISHLHSDHFCPSVLELFPDKSIPVIIKKFKSKRLLNSILSLGFGNVLEIEPWEAFSIGDLTVSIVPQGQTNSAGIDDGLNYDLDTSILVFDEATNVLLFHLTDNSLNLMQYHQLLDYCLSRFKTTPDVATLLCGAASEWPQCFPALDRDFAKTEFLTRELTKYTEACLALSPRFILPGGGRYCLSGKYSSLNKFVALPTYDQLRNATPSPTQFLEIEGGGSIAFSKKHEDGYAQHEVFMTSEPTPPDNLVARPYDFDAFEATVDVEAFYAARNRWLKKISGLNLSFPHSIYLCFYDRLPIDVHGEVDVEEPYPDPSNHNVLPLYEKEDDICSLHYIHIESKAINACIHHGFILKQILSGSLAIQYRSPDVFSPEATFSLAFFGN